MSASNQEFALSLLKPDEGGYSNNPEDNGGPTNLGITLATMRRYIKPDASITDLKALTWDVAKKVYAKQYWAPCHCDELPNGLDYSVFDTSVMSGPSRAIKLLQGVLDIRQDGFVGPQTIGGVRATVVRGGLEAMINTYNDHRRVFLLSLDDYKTFGKGWEARVKRVRTASLKLAQHTGE